jgi:hypothetical protein
VPHQGLAVRLPAGAPGLVASTGLEAGGYVVRAAPMVGTKVGQRAPFATWRTVAVDSTSGAAFATWRTVALDRGIGWSVHAPIG